MKSVKNIIVYIVGCVSFLAIICEMDVNLITFIFIKLSAFAIALLCVRYTYNNMEQSEDSNAQS